MEIPQSFQFLHRPFHKSGNLPETTRSAQTKKCCSDHAFAVRLAQHPVETIEAVWKGRAGETDHLSRKLRCEKPEDPRPETRDRPSKHNGGYSAPWRRFSRVKSTRQRLICNGGDHSNRLPGATTTRMQVSTGSTSVSPAFSTLSTDSPRLFTRNPSRL
jgi:hypothetical protein